VTPELQKYYEERFSMFSQQGWLDLIEDIDKMWWPHLYALHGIFLTQLRPANKKINLNEIHLYIHKLPWQILSFLL
jgi:hypothetical protein